MLVKAGDEAAALIALQDTEGDTPLHLCSHCPMVCYQLAAHAPAICLLPNKAGVTPIDLAFKNGSGEALNALLLACSGSSTPEALTSMRNLTEKGAVPDTWAPNGQSSLMLAAAADSPQGVELLLKAGASAELQDAMGRTALMWAAGSGAVLSLKALLNARVSVAVRDRRGRTAADYAEEEQVKSVLENRVKELEIKAAAAQEALLAELMEEEERKTATKAGKKAKKKAKAKDKKKSSSVSETPTTTTADISSGNAMHSTELEEVQEQKGGELPSILKNLTSQSLSLPAAVSSPCTTSSSSPVKGAWQRGPPIVSPVVSSDVQEPCLPPGTDTLAAGGSTTDEECTTTTTTAPLGINNKTSSSAMCTPPGPAMMGPSSSLSTDGPASPEWCIVVKKDKQQASKSTSGGGSSSGIAVPSGAGTGANNASMSLRAGISPTGADINIQHHHHQHHNHHAHRRTPSFGSVASASSVGSQETDGSKYSGSERSVLHRSVGGNGGNPGGISSSIVHQLSTSSTSAALAGPRLPVPSQKLAMISRSTSGGEEVLVGSVPGGGLPWGGATAVAHGAAGSTAHGSTKIVPCSGLSSNGSQSRSLSSSPTPGSKHVSSWANVAANKTLSRTAAARTKPVAAIVSVATPSKPAWGGAGIQGIKTLKSEVKPESAALATSAQIVSQQSAQKAPVHPGLHNKLETLKAGAGNTSGFLSAGCSPITTKVVPAPPASLGTSSAPSAPSTTSASGEATPTAPAGAPWAGAMAAAAAAAQQHQVAAAEEVAALRSEIQRLRMRNAASELAHHQELAAVLHDASQHEAAAVAKAMTDERLACTIRFASLLQNNGAALAGIIPGLLAGAGINTALDLDFFLSSIVNNTGGANNLNQSTMGAATHSATSNNTPPGGTTAAAAAGVNSNNHLANGGGSDADVLAAMGFCELTHSNLNTTGGTSAQKRSTATPPIAVVLPNSHAGAMNGIAMMTHNGSAGTGLFESSPLSTSPFSFEVGEHLRGDFLGNHSAFIMPALDTGHGVASSPSQDSFRSATAAAAAAAWGVGGSLGESSR